MLQDKGNVPGSIEIWDKLHMISKAIISQFLILCRRQRVRLNNGRSALELKMAFQLESESIDLEECRLPDGALQGLRPIEVVRVVPINLTQLQIGPVLYVDLG